MIIFLNVSLNMCFGCPKERLTEMVLLSTCTCSICLVEKCEKLFSNMYSYLEACNIH